MAYLYASGGPKSRRSEFRLAKQIEQQINNLVDFRVLGSQPYWALKTAPPRPPSAPLWRRGRGADPPSD
jgi:hypothetical protein